MSFLFVPIRQSCEWRFIALAAAFASSVVACSDASSGSVDIPFAVDDRHLLVRDADGTRPIFVRGVNLGVGVPGTQAGELAATREQYDRWFARMGEAGFNTVRVYTLHFPRFYEALDAHNRAHPDRPLFVLHGVWLDEEVQGRDLFTASQAFDADIEEVTDAVHGRRRIDERQGRAFGDYKVDVSRWVMAWVLGREIYPDEVITTNALHPDEATFSGRAFEISGGSPTEVWTATHFEHAVEYERTRYRATRPVSLASWPTLDPLEHPTEGGDSSEDAVSIDVTKIRTVDAPAGYFASYHAYPYYPHFVSEEPSYLAAADDEGANSYLGYLRDLREHYGSIPLLIAEFGVPSSWGNASPAQSGMNHGGQDEVTQGAQAARMFRDLQLAGTAGGAFFSWIDEWWKRTWITDELDFPVERRPLWWNVTAAEQNFGLIAFEPPLANVDAFPPTAGSGTIEELRVAVDAAFFHIRVKTSVAPTPIKPLVLGIDTYGADVGESRLPNGKATVQRSEFALLITPQGAQLYVTRAYNLFGIWHRTSGNDQLYRSVATTGAPWDPVLWKNGEAHSSKDGATTFPASTFEAGKLRVRRADERPSSLDAVVLGEGVIDVRIPWTLLQFTDPSLLSVMNDDRATVPRETAVSEGVALAVVLGEDTVETMRYRWEPWSSAPLTTEREKASLAIVSETLQAMAGGIASSGP